MRSSIHLFVVCAALLGGGGCLSGGLHQPPAGGLIYSDCNLPAFLTAETPMSTSDFRGGPPYERLGRARGQATSTSVLGLVWIGDSGGATAYERALAMAEADALMNPRMDYRGFGIAGLFGQITTSVEGDAIRFKNVEQR